MLETDLFPHLSSYCLFHDMLYFDALSVCKCYIKHLLFPDNISLCDATFRKQQVTTFLATFLLSLLRFTLEKDFEGLQHDLPTIPFFAFFPIA